MSHNLLAMTEGGAWYGDGKGLGKLCTKVDDAIEYKEGGMVDRDVISEEYGVHIAGSTNIEIIDRFCTEKVIAALENISEDRQETELLKGDFEDLGNGIGVLKRDGGPVGGDRGEGNDTARALSLRGLEEPKKEDVADIEKRATQLHKSGELLEARELFERALQMKGKWAMGGDGELELMSTRHNIALILSDLHEFDEAASMLEEIWTTRERILGQNHRLT